MTSVLTVRVPAPTELDIARVVSRMRVVLRTFSKRIGVPTQATRIQVLLDKAVTAVEIEVGGRPFRYPPTLASRVASYLTGTRGIVMGSVVQSWQRVAGSMGEDYVVELVRSMTTEAPELLVGHAEWERWRSGCAKSVTIEVEAGQLRQLSDDLDPALFGWIRNGESVDLGLPLPTLSLVASTDLRPHAFAVQINGIRTTPYTTLPGGWLLTDSTVDEEVEQHQVLVPHRLREGTIVSEANRDRLPAQVGWTGSEYLGVCVYAELRNHADWLVDTEVTENLLDQLAYVAPFTVQAARSRLLDVLPAVLTELLADQVSVRPLGAIAAALLVRDPLVDPPLVRTARSAVTPMIITASLLGGSLPAWLIDPSFVQADGLNVDGVALAVRSAVDGLSLTSPIPVLLAPEQYRAGLAAALRLAVPEVRAVSYDDLPADLPVYVLDRLAPALVPTRTPAATLAG